MSLPPPAPWRREFPSRREFLASLAAAYGIAAFPVVTSAAAPLRRSVLRVRYRTDHGRLSRVIPPGLVADERSEVLIEYTRLDPADQKIESGEAIQIFSAYVAVRQGERSGWMYLGGATGNERWRIRGREFLGLPLKEGEIELKREGAAVKASFARRGNSIQRIETALTDSSPSQPPDSGQPVFCFDCRLSYDWSGALVGPEPSRLIELGSIGTPATPDSGSARSFRRACDLERTAVRWPEATPLDPFAELPAVEVLEAAYCEAADSLPRLLAGGDDAEPKAAATAEPSKSEPWCVLRYDRPVDRNRVWMPDGWRESASAFRLTKQEIEKWRARKEVILDPVDIIDIQFMIGRELHAEIVPPPCRGGIRAMLRLMALRVDSSELSPEPFDEIWLFASCLVENQWAWYSLGHIVGPGGDVTFGRETFGYPSKMGEISTVLRPDGFTLEARRAGRPFVSASGATSGYSTGTSLDEMTVVSLRAESFRGGPPTKGLLIEQPWYFHGGKVRALRETVRIECPEARENSGAPVRDPWFELNPVTPLSAAAFEGGGMQRGPGRVVAEIADVGPYYLERCDGALPNTPLDSPPEPCTFRRRKTGPDETSKTS